MGESSMEAPIADSLMGDSEEAAEVAALQVSVSFGRFENDLLSWEKWSTFPTNKYLEEVEKCSTPGSVAQKKAYFEAHYKKIAARKAEQEDQDKQQQGDETRDPVDSEAQAQSDLLTNFSEAEHVSDEQKLNDQNTVAAIELEHEVANSASEMSTDKVDEPKDSLVTANENKDSVLLIDEVEGESCCKLVSPQLHESEESALVKDEAPSRGSERVEELPQHIDNARDTASVDKEEKVKSEKMLKSRKANATKKATSTTVLKKNPAASTPKLSLLSTPKLSRPTLSKSTMSDSRISPKKEHGSSPLINRKPTRAESRRVAPTSLHMSLSLGSDRPAKTEPAPSTTMRKSLFMEKMGDKDIVKRAFRAFRNDFNHPSFSSPGKPALASQIPGKDTRIKAVVGTPEKKIEGVNNLVKRSPQSSQPGLRKTLNSTRFPHTSVGANQRNVKSVSSNYGLRSHDKPDKRKEKLGEKGNGIVADRTQLQSKVKKEAEIKRQSHDHYTKSKPILGTAKLKSPIHKSAK